MAGSARDSVGIMKYFGSNSKRPRHADKVNYSEVVASGEKLRMYQAPNRKPPDQLRDPIVCQKCGQEGHFARGCAQRKAGND